jgi:phosphatidylserine decarboxylase
VSFICSNSSLADLSWLSEFNQVLTTNTCNHQRKRNRVLHPCVRPSGAQRCAWGTRPVRPQRNLRLAPSDRAVISLFYVLSINSLLLRVLFSAQE